MIHRRSAYLELRYNSFERKIAIFFFNKKHQVSRPIFIIGSGRSGTSVLLSTLRKTLNLPGHGEGHFHPIAASLLSTTDKYYHSHRSRSLNNKHMLHDVEVDLVRKKIETMVAEIYLEQYGKNDFVDKTPGPHGVRGIPFIQNAFPNMRVIFAQRRGIEVVRSSVKKFPQVPFEGHCKIWKDCMVNWQTSRYMLNVPYLEVDQIDLAMNPLFVAKKIGKLLELKQNQIDMVQNYLTTDRPQSSGSLNSGAISIDTIGWDDEKIETFRRICGSTMEDYGYLESTEYKSTKST